MRSRSVVATVVAASLFLAGCGLGGPAHQRGPETADHIIEMSMTSFRPASVMVRSGETVEWRNTSVIGHTVTADAERVDDPTSVEVPDDAERFHSGDIPAGEIYRRTFTEPGTYRYVCLPHEHAGMIGTIVVSEG